MQTSIKQGMVDLQIIPTSYTFKNKHSLTLSGQGFKKLQYISNFFSTSNAHSAWVLTQKRSTWALIYRKFIVDFINGIIFEFQGHDQGMIDLYFIPDKG